MFDARQFSTLQCGIAKLGNGYAITLMKATPPPVAIHSEDAADPDEMLDKMIEGLGALVRSIGNHGDGEAWKNDDDKAKIREAFKLMVPGSSRHVLSAAEGFAMPPPPESLVFESKARLIEYLIENL